MINKRYISKKLIWNGTEKMQNHLTKSCCKTACFWAIFCAISNQFFWYVPFVYHYYIIKFHHLGPDRHTKNVRRWCAHQAHFLWRFLKFEKNVKSYGRTRMFLSDFSIFWICALIHFFNICILYIIIILCKVFLKSIRDTHKFFQVCATNWHIFPARRLNRVFAYFLAQKWSPSWTCACCATINLSVQILQKVL